MPVASAAPLNSPFGSRTQRMRRRRTLLTLSASTLLTSAAALVVNSILVDVAALTAWTGLLGFLGLMYYAMSSGLISSSTFRNRPAPLRTAAPIVYNEFDLAYEAPRDAYGSDDDDQRFARAL